MGSDVLLSEYAEERWNASLSCHLAGSAKFGQSKGNHTFSKSVDINESWYSWLGHLWTGSPARIIHPKKPDLHNSQSNIQNISLLIFPSQWLAYIFTIWFNNVNIHSWNEPKVLQKVILLTKGTCKQALLKPQNGNVWRRHTTGQHSFLVHCIVHFCCI